MIDGHDWLAQLTLVAHWRVNGNVALIAAESFAANAAAGRMADEIIVQTLGGDRETKNSS